MGALRNFTVLLGSVLIMGTGCSSDNGDEAIFEERPETISKEEVQYELTVVIIPEGGGSVTPRYGVFEDGHVLKVKAVPNAGYIFNSWTGSVASQQAEHEVIMDSNKYLIARFDPTPYWVNNPR